MQMICALFRDRYDADILVRQNEERGMIGVHGPEVRALSSEAAAYCLPKLDVEGGRGVNTKNMNTLERVSALWGRNHSFIDSPFECVNYG